MPVGDGGRPARAGASGLARADAVEPPRAAAGQRPDQTAASSAMRSIARRTSAKEVVSGESPRRIEFGRPEVGITPAAIIRRVRSPRVGAPDRDMRPAPRGVARAAEREPQGRQHRVMQGDRVLGQGDPLRPDPPDPRLRHQPDSLLGDRQPEDARRPGQPAGDARLWLERPGPSRTARPGRTSPGSGCAARPGARDRT